MQSKVLVWVVLCRMRYSGVDYLKPLTPYLALLATPVTSRPKMVVSPSPRLSRPCTGHNPADPAVTGMSRAGKLQLSCKTQDHILATKDFEEGLSHHMARCW